MNLTAFKLIFFQIYAYILLAYYKMVKIMTLRILRFGSLEVTGTGEVTIEVGKRRPRDVSVSFEDNPKMVPCNNHHDKLTYKVIKDKHKFFLVIEWHVTDTRIIKWSFYH